MVDHPLVLYRSGAQRHRRGDVIAPAWTPLGAVAASLQIWVKGAGTSWVLEGPVPWSIGRGHGPHDRRHLSRSVGRGDAGRTVQPGRWRPRPVPCCCASGEPATMSTSPPALRDVRRGSTQDPDAAPRPVAMGVGPSSRMFPPFPVPNVAVTQVTWSTVRRNEEADDCRTAARTVRTRVQGARRAPRDRPGDVPQDDHAVEKGRHHRSDPGSGRRELQRRRAGSGPGERAGRYERVHRRGTTTGATAAWYSPRSPLSSWQRSSVPRSTCSSARRTRPRARP